MAQHDYSAKTIFWYLLNGVLLVAVVFGLMGVGTLVRYSNAISPSRIIQVSGEGKVDITPDVATITASVVNRGTDANKVQSENTEKMNSVVAFVKSQSIPASDIKTTGYNLYPTNRWDPKSGEQIPTGFEATQTITIKIRGIDKAKEKAGVIAGGLVPAGANQVNGVQYDVENPEGQRTVARQMAFNNAFMKARSMAAQNHVQIARVITFSESGDTSMPPIYYAKAMGGASDVAVPPTPSIEPGSQEVRVNVSVTYEIR